MRTSQNPGMTITLKVGNLFHQPNQLVVGFSDTFDTDTTNDKIISSRSLQGQLLVSRYSNDVHRLDSELSRALASVKPAFTEDRTAKPAGKLDRYELGTVAVLGQSETDRVYAVAYSRMSNDLVAKSSVHDLWLALGSLWDAVYIHGQRRPVSMPLLGSGLARINCLDSESLLKMELLSFVSRSQEELICKELNIVIYESDAEQVNMLEMAAFLKTL